MPIFLVIIIEIFVRLIVAGLLAWLTFYLYGKRSKWLYVSGLFAIVVAINILIPSSYTPNNRLTFSHTYTAEQAKQRKVNAEKKEESKKNAKQESHAKAESQKVISSEAKEKSEVKASIVESNHNKNTVKVGNIPYQKVSLVDFTDNPNKYDGKNIQTTGQVILIQRNNDNANMYFVVIAPTDSSTTSGYADGHGTVAQIDIDTMKENKIKTGDNLIVNGGGLVDQITFNGKTVKTSIIVDSVSKY
ncbi:hypothetical protein [Lentilactobacillus senioris]|uniref:hypothetical protein n=1 Tax=Lentilactobacillus senioris TaxID=931534 RepID=UPI003D290AE8